MQQATEADGGNKEAKLVSEGTVAERVDERVERVKEVRESNRRLIDAQKQKDFDRRHGLRSLHRSGHEYPLTHGEIKSVFRHVGTIPQ